MSQEPKGTPALQGGEDVRLCACRKGCTKEVKGPGRYALGHHPNSDQGRMPQILRKLREKEKVEAQHQGMEA